MRTQYTKRCYPEGTVKNRMKNGLYAFVNMPNLNIHNFKSCFFWGFAVCPFLMSVTGLQSLMFPVSAIWS